jgi:hypothetical protein
MRHRHLAQVFARHEIRYLIPLSQVAPHVNQDLQIVGELTSRMLALIVRACINETVTHFEIIERQLIGGRKWREVSSEVISPKMG